MNANHPVGQHKAHVINSVLGYNEKNWEEFSNKLFREVQKSPFSKVSTANYGIKYEVPIIMYGKKGRFLKINTIWQIDNGSNIPRFISATFDKKKGGT